jgi:hypothetical protein
MQHFEFVVTKTMFKLFRGEKNLQRRQRRDITAEIRRTIVVNKYRRMEPEWIQDKF